MDNYENFIYFDTKIVYLCHSPMRLLCWAIWIPCSNTQLEQD